MSCTFFQFLKPDEQLVLEGPSSISVVNGPAIPFYAPIVNRAHKRKALQLEEQQYAKVKDTLTGVITTVAGPAMHFLGPYDEHVGTHNKLVLLNHQYARLVDSATGDVRIEKGERTLLAEHEHCRLVIYVHGVGHFFDVLVRCRDDGLPARGHVAG